MKPKLLVLELWGIGDLVIASPFLRAASKKYDVTLVAKPYARTLRDSCWPDVEVIHFVAPWTSFREKYHVHRWAWDRIFRLRKRAVASRFDFGISARWDPRDHLLLWATRAKQRISFPRMGSGILLSRSLELPGRQAHRYDYWRTLGAALEVDLPTRSELSVTPTCSSGPVLIHSGAGQTLRVWPLERFRMIAQRLRHDGYEVKVACDPDQRPWWVQSGELAVETPRSVSDLFDLVRNVGVFIGNDSGPGHLAAACGVPTLSIFGPQVPEWFVPLHPQAEYIEGQPCDFKPCSDYCNFIEARCIIGVEEMEVLRRARAFLEKHSRRVAKASASASVAKSL